MKYHDLCARYGRQRQRDNERSLESPMDPRIAEAYASVVGALNTVPSRAQGAFTMNLLLTLGTVLFAASKAGALDAHTEAMLASALGEKRSVVMAAVSFAATLDKINLESQV